MYPLAGAPPSPPVGLCGRSTGAAADRPWRYSHPKSLASCPILMLLGKCFVNKSAGSPSPLILRTCIPPVRTFSRTQRVCVSRCLNSPRPARPALPSAAPESVHTRAGTFNQKSIMIDWCPSPAPAAFTKPCNSTSPDDNVTDGCVDDQVLITCRPIITQLPLVNRRVRRHPLQSVLRRRLLGGGATERVMQQSETTALALPGGSQRVPLSLLSL